MLFTFNIQYFCKGVKQMEEIFLGIDAGTSSCGWAVTNDRYEIVRAKRKKLWGVRLFDEALSAEERRAFRTGRRRLERRKLKLAWLKEVFESQIAKIDPFFFDRLMASSLYLDDKTKRNGHLTSKNSLFAGEIDGRKYTDKEFFKNYPTIYHLREELTQSPAKDIRFLYLALHNIVKRRGHFLFDGDIGKNQNLNNVVAEFIEAFKNVVEFSSIHLPEADEILKILKNDKGIRDKKKDLADLFGSKTKAEKAVVCAMVDGKINLKDIFEIDEEENSKLNFSDEEIDTTIASLSFLKDEEMQMLEKLKNLYSTIVLKKFLGDKDFICQAHTELYKKHKYQLETFKKFIREYYPDEYSKMFRRGQSKTFKDVNYAVYVNGSIFGGQKQVARLGGTTSASRDDFYKYVKLVLDKKKDGDENFTSIKKEILLAMENGDFLNKQRSKVNATFPNQLYVNEAKQILEVNSKKYPFLNEKDESGLSNAEKIIKIIEYRVPYFVGPIGGQSPEQRKFAWAEKENNIPLRPWTLNKIVDFDRAEESFISRMTGKCSQLPTEDVLPKQSILYSKFMVLDELNNLKINGENISVQLKQQIFEGLFERENKVTIKKLKDFLKAEFGEETSSWVFEGINKEFKNNFGVYAKLANNTLFGKQFIDENLDMFEEIIKLKTIIADKNRLDSQIKKKFGDKINDAQIKELKSLTCTGWGRLSKKFLKGLLFADENGEAMNVIDRLWNTNQNLMEIVNDSNLTLQEELRKYRKAKFDTITYQDVDALYCSPAVKRSVWQVIKIIDEVKLAIGKMPDKIFVEVARERRPDIGEKLSRQKNLLEIYNSADFKDSVKGLSFDLQELLNELNKDDTASKIKSEKLYLYFLQLGKCAYTGDPLSIDEVFDGHSCDVDHIIPQAMIKDDSIDNKVLVRSQYNRAKEADYPIFNKHPDWVERQQAFWKILHNCKLISDKKYANLIRKTPISDQELGGFIARQMVETHQTAKAVIELLKNMVDDPRRIVYSKASMTNEFKTCADIIKCRSVNDLHHAKDAYLNIVAGNILYSRFTDDPRNFYKSNNKNSRITKNVSKIFEHTIYSPKTGEVIWQGKDDILRVKEICEKNDCLVSRMNYAKKNGAFYDATVYKNEKNSKLIGEHSKAKISLKGKNNPTSDIKLYGGYNSEAIAYYMLIESEKNGKKIKTIESVPVMIYKRFEKEENRDQKIFEYLADRYNLENAKILIPKINLASTLKIGGGEYWLTAKSGDFYQLKNANQWRAPRWCVQIIKNLEKFAELERMRRVESSGVEVSEKEIAFTQSDKTLNQERLITKDKNLSLYNEMMRQFSLNCYKDVQLYNLSDVLKAEKNNFENLSIKEQVSELLAIVKGLCTNSKGVKFVKLNNAKNIGIVTLNKNITDKNISLIMRSQTGIYEKVVKL